MLWFFARFGALLLSGVFVAQACAQQPSPSQAHTPSPSAPASAMAGPAPAASPEAPQLVTYQFGLLRKGPKWTPEPTEETKRIQEGHLANITRLADEGKLAMAGPLEAAKGSDLRGVFVFKVASIEEARALTASDPAVKAGRLVIDLYSFLGTSGLGTRYLAAKAKGTVGELTRYQLVLMKDGPRYDPKQLNENSQLGLARRAWMRGMAEQNPLLLAGPFSGQGSYRGLLVLGLASPEQASTVVSEDPLVKTERMAFEAHTWWVAKGVLD
jgi:uncharacterized protein YciI